MSVGRGQHAADAAGAVEAVGVRVGGEHGARGGARLEEEASERRSHVEVAGSESPGAGVEGRGGEGGEDLGERGEFGGSREEGDEGEYGVDCCCCGGGGGGGSGTRSFGRGGRGR